MRSVRRAASSALVLFVVMLLTSGKASACSVCMSIRQETLDAFRLTTVLLSLLPLGMIGGLVWWVIRQLKRAEVLEAPSVGTPGAPYPVETEPIGP